MPIIRSETNPFSPARMLGAFAAAICVSTCFATVAMSADQPETAYQSDLDSPFGKRNPNGPKELAQFDFVIGEWDVDLTLFPRQGEPAHHKAQWRNIWIVDGHVVLQEWRGPFATGAELRAWDSNEQRWVGKNIYAGSDWRSTYAEFADGKMVVYNQDARDAGGPFINRETYYDIGPDSFKMKSDKSYDAGKTWVRGNYEMAATRMPD